MLPCNRIAEGDPMKLPQTCELDWTVPRATVLLATLRENHVAWLQGQEDFYDFLWRSRSWWPGWFAVRVNAVLIPARKGELNT